MNVDVREWWQDMSQKRDCDRRCMDVSSQPTTVARQNAIHCVSAKLVPLLRSSLHGFEVFTGYAAETRRLKARLVADVDVD